MGRFAVAPPSLRFQGSLLLEDSWFYSIALLYQPLLDRHGTWLIGYRSREAIQFSRNIMSASKKIEGGYMPSFSWVLVSTFYVMFAGLLVAHEGISVSW